MQCSPPFFSFPGVCDKHNVPQIMVVLGCLFARKPMARAGCKYPLPASRKSIPNTDTFPARPYIRPDNTHISFLTKFLGQANVCIQRFTISKLVYSDNLHLLTSSEYFPRQTSSNKDQFHDSNLTIYYAKIFHQQILFQLYLCCPSYRVLISIFALALLVEYPACLGSDICAVSDVHCLIAKVSPQLIPHCWCWCWTSLSPLFQAK